MVSVSKKKIQFSPNNFLKEDAEGIVKPEIDNLNTCPYIKIADPVELRGELFVDRLVFEELKQKTHYKNCRATIAGFINNKKGVELIADYESVIFFDVITNPRVMTTETTLDFIILQWF